jgi:hypothetical protein
VSEELKEMTPLERLHKLCVTVAYASAEWDHYNDHVVHSSHVVNMAIEIERLKEALDAVCKIECVDDLWKAQEILEGLK